MVYQLGEEEVNFNNVLGEIRSSFPDEDISVLNQRLNKDGYLCLRNLIPQNEVLNARKIFYEFLKNKINFSNDSTIEKPKSENGSLFFGGKKEITHHPEFINILEHPNSFNFFKKLFSYFKHNLILNKCRMRFKLFYTFIFLYWSVIIFGPFVN